MSTIPKVIHYVWVGPQEFPKLGKRCIKSWKKHLPDYEIKCWNESNIPMDHHYVKEMYQQKKWAFVSDYVRFWVLSREGGVYLDTDTEVLKSFNDLLSNDVFFGKTKDGFTAAGVIGSVAGHSVIKDILSEYEKDRSYSIENTSPKIITRTLQNGNYLGVVVYDYQYFNPCDDGERCGAIKLQHAYTNNHWAESWVPHRKLRKIARRLGVIRVIKEIKKYVT